MSTRTRSGGEFDHGLLGEPCWLELRNGERVVLPTAQWRNIRPDAGDELMLARCGGNTLDVGCGPGRLTAALANRGVAALGVDTSPVAVELTRRRGARALRTDVFDTLPGEGQWAHVLLADGNIGIGGDPVALLRRAARLLRATGTVLVEVEPHGKPLRSELVRVAGDGTTGRWFQWAWLGAGALPDIARQAGMRVSWLGTHRARWFAEVTAVAAHQEVSNAAAPAPSALACR